MGKGRLSGRKSGRFFDPMPRYSLSHLQQLEAEAIFVLRETAAQFTNPGLLFSGGKDSIVMAWLARKGSR